MYATKSTKNFTGTKERAWVITWNNWTEDNLVTLQSEQHDYMIIGKEVGECGTPHLQAYIYFHSKIGFNGLQKRIRGAHIEAAKGTPLQNQVYCSKEKNFEEFGTLPQQGKRTDIIVIKETLKKSGKISDLWDVVSNLNQMVIAEKIIKYIEPKRNFKTLVHWYWGDTGCGKSTAADVEFGGEDNYHRCSAYSWPWWDGYDGEENVVIDDIKDDSYKNYQLLLDVCDRWQCRVPVKGHFRSLLAKKIIITSRFHPAELFGKHDGNACELLRRIEVIKHFEK